jgi:hypothetical protein
MVGQSPSFGGLGMISRGEGQSPAAGVGQVPFGRGFATTGVDLDPLGQAPTQLDLPARDVPVDLPLSNVQGTGIPSDDKAPTQAISISNRTDVQQPATQQSSEPITQQAERTVVAPAERAMVRDFFQAVDGR